jgi:hypothetical protein
VSLVESWKRDVTGVGHRKVREVLGAPPLVLLAAIGRRKIAVEERDRGVELLPVAAHGIAIDVAQLFERERFT